MTMITAEGARILTDVSNSPENLDHRIEQAIKEACDRGARTCSISWNQDQDARAHIILRLQELGFSYTDTAAFSEIDVHW